MTTAQANSRKTRLINKSKKNIGRYKTMEELSAAKMESAREFIANIDMTLFLKNGPLE